MIELDKLKRYELTYRNDFNDKYSADADEDKDGDWVRFSDVEELLASQPATVPAQAAYPAEQQAILDEQVRIWHKEVARLNDLIAHATGQISSVTAAGQGAEDATISDEMWCAAEAELRPVIDSSVCGNDISNAIHRALIAAIAAKEGKPR